MNKQGNTSTRSVNTLIGIAMMTSLLFGFVEPVSADVVVTPTALTIGIPTGQTTASGSITAKNTGAAPVTLKWRDNVACLQKPAQQTRTLAAGEASIFIVQGLCPATGSATLSGTGVPTVTIPVSITTAPSIGYSPTSLVYAGTVGTTNPSTQTITISNAGGGTLNWTASSNVTWLSLSPPSGIGAATITATMNPSALLLSGLYNAVVTVSAVGAVTRTIPVTLTMSPSTTGTTNFSISPLSLAYTAEVGGPNKLGNLTVTNSGTSSLTVTWYDQINWLAPSSGDTVTMPPGGTSSMTLTASPAGLTAGSYSGTATIAGGGITKQVPVTLTVVNVPSTTVTFTWDANNETDLAGYNVYSRTSSEAYAVPIATLPKGTTSYTVTGLQAGTVYYFAITAYDAAGNESSRSSELSKTISY